MAEVRAVRVMISGRVQGVGFRAWTERRARDLGLSGWVRNRSSGEVEAVFCGRAEAVEAMIAACRTGPPHGRVVSVGVLDEAAPATAGFEVLPDG